jgi:hypothetical protein
MPESVRVGYAIVGAPTRKLNAKSGTGAISYADSRVVCQFDFECLSSAMSSH